MSHILKITDLNRIDYKSALEIQQNKVNGMIIRRDKASLGHATEHNLFLCEHNPVYTIGKSGDERNLLINNDMLNNEGITFIKTNRGGDITFHGPGQIVAYPLFDLKALDIGIKNYVFLLEEVIISLLKHFNLNGERLDNAAGVWLDTTYPVVRKISAIGIKVSRHITMHGLALNVNTDLAYFNNINPCGFTNRGVTSMAKEKGRIQDMEAVKSLLVNCFEKVFFS